MKENLKKFLEEASKNEELKAKLDALKGKNNAVAKTIEIAKEYGFTLTAEDFEPDENDELSLDELNQVAGGKCYFSGGGNDKCGKTGGNYCCNCIESGSGTLA